MQSRGLRVVLTGWAVLLGLLCITAFAKREADHRTLRTKLIADLAPVAEDGSHPVDDYIWGPQGQAIYLLNHGYASPALLRSLLLCEARRCYDWKYLYTRVANYDLRTRLIAHCENDFPEDPGVAWAAGQLSLAAGDYQNADEFLFSAIELALHGYGQSYADRAGIKATGLSGFCQGLGISEQHLRGRYTCALTLTGNWVEADKQAALAKTAGDGPPAPALDPFLDTPQDAAKWSAQQAFLRERHAVAAQYATTHDPKVITDWLKALDSRLAGLDYTSGGKDTPKEYEAYQMRLIAYSLAKDWPAVEKLISKPADAWYSYGQYPYADDDIDHTTLRLQSATLLTRLAKGGKLGSTAPDRRAARLAELRQENPGQSEADWKWDLNGADTGELSGLLEADYLPFLLRTDMFADALQKSGRKLPDVLAEVRAVTQPQRDTYSDYSNGDLQWK